MFAAKRCCYDLSFGFEFSGEFGVLADFILVFEVMISGVRT